MKTVILAGGLGSRLAEFTNVIPKPMVKIGDKPILWHIMNIFSNYNHKDFYLALGYKSEVIVDYFLNYRSLNSNISIELKTGKINTYQDITEDWKIHLINTGFESMTGGRLKRMKEYIGDETFFLTYGDGISDVNLNSLLDFHKSHKKLVTVTAVHPVARFGEIKITNKKVINFTEKPQTKTGWINGGFFVVEPEFLEYIESDETILEKEPLEKAAEIGELKAFEHEGFWQCMDTKRDMDLLNNLWKNNLAPWTT